MTDATEEIFQSAQDHMAKAIAHLDTELTKVRAGKASAGMLDGIVVDYYGNPTPIGQVANITTPDARTITLQPWEKNMMAPIEKAIMQSNIGLNPQNDGTLIRLFLPPLTEERRKDLVKRVNAEGEVAKIAVRSIRRDAVEGVRKAQKDGLSEDAGKQAEARIQTITDKMIAEVETHCAAKEKDIMTI